MISFDKHDDCSKTAELGGNGGSRIRDLRLGLGNYLLVQPISPGFATRSCSKKTVMVQCFTRSTENSTCAWFHFVKSIHYIENAFIRSRQSRIHKKSPMLLFFFKFFFPLAIGTRDFKKHRPDAFGGSQFQRFKAKS